MTPLSCQPCTPPRTPDDAPSPSLGSVARALASALLVAVAQAACTDPGALDGGALDAALDAPRGDVMRPVFDEGVRVDVRDVVTREGGIAPPNAVAARALFRPCRDATDCNPEGTNIVLFCDQNYPAGMCRRTLCGADIDCGTAGTCGGVFGCLPRCDRSGVVDPCGPASSVCLSHTPPLRTEVGCFPSCYRAAPSGFPACNPGSQCDPYSGRCVVSPNDMGRDNGEPCARDADCRSARCALDAISEQLPTGNLGGVCVSTGRQVSPETFRTSLASTGSLPQSNCPDGSVVYPDGQDLGAPTACLRACASDTECRPGYRCDFAAGALGSGSAAFRRGACRPVDCGPDPSRCPSGTRCVTAPSVDAGAPVGRCTARPPTDPPDAGVDAARTDVNEDTTTDAAGASDTALDVSAAP